MSSAPAMETASESRKRRPEPPATAPAFALTVADQPYTPYGPLGTVS